MRLILTTDIIWTRSVKIIDDYDLYCVEGKVMSYDDGLAEYSRENFKIKNIEVYQSCYIGHGAK